MEVKRAKILLEKINALFRSINMEEDKIATIERDLMLSYIRQLYDVFLDNEAEENQQVASPRATSSGAAAPNPPEQRPQPEVLKRRYKPPRIIEIPDAEKEPPPATPPKTEPAPPKAEPPRAIPQEPVAPSKQSTPNPELEALFEQKKATELSEKLGESPVTDLTKSMAINDRLLFMNELFGRDMNNLDDTLRRLNQFTAMAEAKPLLLELAGRYDWNEEERQEVAKSFIKLVRRRYL